MKMQIKRPKDPLFRRILTFSVLQTAAVIVSLSCVVAYMVNNELSKGRWAFFIFACCLALLFAVFTAFLYAADIPRIYTNFNWPLILSVPTIILSILVFIGSVVVSIHISHGCMKYCALVTVAAVSAFFLTFLFLFESFIFFMMQPHEAKCESKTVIVSNIQESNQL